MKFPKPAKSNIKTVKQRFPVPRPQKQFYKSEGIPRFGVPEDETPAVEQIIFVNDDDPDDPDLYGSADDSFSKCGSEFVPTLDAVLTKIVFPKMGKVGDPIADVIFRVYDIANLSGPDGNGLYDLGSPVSESNVISAESLPDFTEASEFEFTFSPLSILASGKYFVALEIENIDTIDADNCPVVLLQQFDSNPDLKAALYQVEFSGWTYDENNDELLMTVYGEA